MLRTLGTIRLVIVLGLILTGVAAKALHLGDYANDGKIQFGASLSANNDLQGTRTAFSAGEPFAWRATLNNSVSNTTLMRSISQVQANGANKVLDSVSVPITKTDVGYVYGQGNTADLASIGIKAPGTFTMRYYQGNTLLAQGTFTLQ